MMARSGGTNVASHAQEILRALDLAHHPLEVPLANLSGGERAKVALARQLVGLSEIDVFFLDEPTNHLDLTTLDWLEEFLITFQGALLLVSHDRYFLDRVCNQSSRYKILEPRGTMAITPHFCNKRNFSYRLSLIESRKQMPKSSD